MLVAFGSVADRIGRRRMALKGAGLFGLASIAAAFSFSPLMLIGARSVMGIGAAALSPPLFGLLTGMFRSERQRSAAFGIFMACFMGGMILGLIPKPRLRGCAGEPVADDDDDWADDDAEHAVRRTGVRSRPSGRWASHLPRRRERRRLHRDAVERPFGAAPLPTLGTHLIVGSVPLEKASSATSTSETSGQLGYALGIALLGSIVTLVYRLRLPPLAGLSDAARAAATESIAGAARIWADSPSHTAIGLRDAAALALCSGLQTVAVLSAVVMIP
ncbi:MAG: MFS transporter [Pseudomonadota bacterium]|nr:MFS transporter [Pseudomonadota bacterium]